MMPQYRVLDDTADLEPHFLIASPELAHVTVPNGRTEPRVHRATPVARQDHWLFNAGSRFSAGGNYAAIGERLEHGLPLSILGAHKARRALQFATAAFETTFRALEPSLLLMPGDRELGFVMPALKAAANLGIPTLISEIAVPNPGGQIGTRRDQWRFTLRPRWKAPILNRYVAWRYPDQVAPHEFTPMLFTPGWLTLACHSLGVVSQHPWVQGGGLSSAVVCTSSAHRDVLVSHGVAAEKCHIVGDISHDVLYSAFSRRAEVRSEILHRYAFDPSRPFVVFAVPNYAEHKLLSWEAHMAGLEAVLKSFRKLPVNILLSLHPKSDVATYAPVAARFGYPIFDGPLPACLPVADVYVAGGSSTIEWAVLCGIPVINVNYADLSLAIWRPYSGIESVSSPSDAGPALGRLVSCAAEMAKAREAQAAAARVRWNFDGRATDRFLGLVRELASRGTTLATPQASSGIF